MTNLVSRSRLDFATECCRICSRTYRFLSLPYLRQPISLPTLHPTWALVLSRFLILLTIVTTVYQPLSVSTRSALIHIPWETPHRNPQDPSRRTYRNTSITMTAILDIFYTAALVFRVSRVQATTFSPIAGPLHVLPMWALFPPSCTLLRHARRPM
jgi:hypothetical protein